MKTNALHEAIRCRQADGCTVCPRCGRRMKPQLYTNALSRQLAGVYVCDDCGMDEALREFARYPMPLEEGSAARMLGGK